MLRNHFMLSGNDFGDVGFGKFYVTGWSAALGGTLSPTGTTVNYVPPNITLICRVQAYRTPRCLITSTWGLMRSYENVLNRNMRKTRSDVSGPVMMYSRHVHVRGNDQLVCIPLSLSLCLSVSVSQSLSASLSC